MTPDSPDKTAPEAAGAARAKRYAIVGIVGRTNAGKSTLVNAIVGDKVSIVSPVVQTTRNVVRGVFTDRRGQLVLVDTPGLHKSEGNLGTLMNRMARQASANVNILVVVVDASRAPQLEDEGWFRRALFAEQPVIFALNKCDRGATPNVQKFHAAWKAIQEEKGRMRDDVQWLEISAARGRNIPQLLEKLFALAEPGEPYFPADTVTDYPRPLAIADVVRESLFKRLNDELPHEIGVRIDGISENGRSWQIRATIFVNRPSQRPIVLGPKGRTLRAVRREAEPEISAIFDVEASLELWVKVEKDWAKNIWLLRQMGYDQPR